MRRIVAAALIVGAMVLPAEHVRAHPSGCTAYADGSAAGRCEFVASAGRLTYTATTSAVFEIYAIRYDDEGRPYKVRFASMAWDGKSYPGKLGSDESSVIPGETVHVFVGGPCNRFPGCANLGVVHAVTHDAEPA